LPIFNRARNKR